MTFICIRAAFYFKAGRPAVHSAVLSSFERASASIYMEKLEKKPLRAVEHRREHE
jgi:hypothetical protein